MRLSRLRLLPFLAITTLLVGGHGSARASGFQIREQSAEGMGNAFAGSTAKAYDVSTVFNNPAGMARLEGDQIGASATWIQPYSQFQGSGSVGGAPISGSNGGNHTDTVGAGAVYGMWALAPDWRLGVALTTPFGMRSSYSGDWVGRYQALDTMLTDINFSPSVSYRVDDRLSVAVGLQVGYLDTLQTNAINFGAVVPGATDGLFRVYGNDIALGWTASALYQFDDSTRLGLSYRSSVRHAIRGQAKFQGVPAPLAGQTAFANSDVDMVVTLPDSVAVGLYHDISPQWAVMSDVVWTHWSVIRDLRVGFDSGRPDVVLPQNWHDTVFVAVGTAYRPNDRLSLHLGTAFDRSPVGDRFRTALLPDANRIWLTGGVSYAVAPTHRLSLSYGHIFIGTANIDQTASDGISRLVGHYDNHADMVSLSYDVRF